MRSVSSQLVVAARTLAADRVTVNIDRGRGRTFALAASIALVLLGVLVLVWALSAQQRTPPTPDASQSLSQTQGETDAKTATKQPETAQAEEVKVEEVDVEAMVKSTPVSVDIPSIDVTSDLHALGLNEDGTLQVPTGQLYDQAAWYDGSPTPGELGPSVIEGHVTSQGSVPSVFFDLGQLNRGDTVEVTREDGSVATFEVYATDSFPKDDFPKAAVYGNTEVPELRLITCGGDYDAQARAHLDNIVVFAKLVTAA